MIHIKEMGSGKRKKPNKQKRNCTEHYRDNTNKWRKSKNERTWIFQHEILRKVFAHKLSRMLSNQMYREENEKFTVATTFLF